MVAIAKDEAAYLSDWIFHHLYFGFDSIDIYVNRTQDNTYDLLKKLSKVNSVNFLDGDKFLDSDNQEFQLKVYNHAYHGIVDSEFTHIMYIDIDEFWVPLNFKDSIHDCLDKVIADVISFEWLLKIKENQMFGEPFEVANEGLKARWVKSIFNKSINIQSIQVHNVHAFDTNYRLADGTPFEFNGWRNGRVSEIEKSGPLKPYFLLHRFFRSEMEYVSLLGRAIPESNTQGFKQNRAGFYGNTEKSTKWMIDNVLLEKYMLEKRRFIANFHLEPIEIESKAFVQKRYLQVIEMIKDAPLSDKVLLNQILRNVRLDEVKLAHYEYLRRYSNDTQLNTKDVDLLRDVAIRIQNQSPKQALKLLRLCAKARPDGPVINELLNKLTSKLANEDN